MALELWLGFALATSILVVIPGPTILAVISYSVAYGNRATFPLIAAVALGDSTALFMSLAGLGAVLATSAWLFTLIKWMGGLYLIYLGIKLITTRGSVLVENTIEPTGTRWKLFSNTWLITALNPKGIIFFIAFLPQFINPNAAAAQQLWILSITFVVIATLNAALYAIFATHARKLLTTARSQRIFNIGGGSMLALAGAWAITASRAN